MAVVTYPQQLLFSAAYAAVNKNVAMQMVVMFFSAAYAAVNSNIQKSAFFSNFSAAYAAVNLIYIPLLIY